MHHWLGIPVGGFARGFDKYFQVGGRCERKFMCRAKVREGDGHYQGNIRKLW